MPHPIQVRNVEDTAKGWPSFEQHVRQFRAAQRVVSVAQRDGGTKRRQPGTVETRHVLLGPAAERHRVRLEGTHGDAALLPC